MTVEEYQLALCLAGTTIRSSDGEERFVPFLEGVREKCPDWQEWHNASGHWETWHKDCLKCQGRGWIPRQGVVPYAQALYQLWEHDIRHYDDFEDVGWAIFKSELAVLKTIAKALGVGQ